MFIGSSGGTAVNSAAVVAAPIGLAVLACCFHCALLWRCLLSCVFFPIVYHFLVWFIMRVMVINHLFLFRRPPPSDSA